MYDLLSAAEVSDYPTLVTHDVDALFEFGTERHRAHIYATLVARYVPPGVPIIVSDDAAAWAAVASVTARNPLIGVLHSDGDNYYQLARKYAVAAGALVCVSRRIERTLQKHLPSPVVPIATIPCGTPLPTIVPRASCGPVLRLAWVGRMSEVQKRVSDLPKIAAVLRATGTRFHLDIVGDGPDREGTARAFALAQLQAEVQFHGWLDAAGVRRILSAADVLLLPSNFEGMPVAVMEALAVGCAVVASRVGGIEDLEHHVLAQHCLLVHEVGDVDTAASYVRQLYAFSPRERSRAARLLAETELSIDGCVRRYTDIVVRATHAGDRRNISIGGTTWTGIASLVVAIQRRARVWMRRRLSVAAW